MSSFPTFVSARDPEVLDGWKSRWSHLARWEVDFQSATDYEGMDRSRTLLWSETNAVSSEIVESVSTEVGTKGKHAVLLDLDARADLLPSSTHDHFHLYIDTALPWRKYKVLLRVLAWCGIIEKGYYRASKRRKATFLRTPSTKKEDQASMTKLAGQKGPEKKRIDFSNVRNADMEGYR